MSNITIKTPRAKEKLSLAASARIHTCTCTNTIPLLSDPLANQKSSNLPNFSSNELPEVEAIISMPTDHGKAVLTVGQLPNHSINLNIDILDDTFLKQMHVILKG